MRILQVVHGFPPEEKAGIQILVYNLSKELSERHEVSVFYPVHRKGINEYYIDSFKKGKIEKSKLIVKESLLDMAAKLFYSKFTDLYYIANEKIERGFEELLNNINPDIVCFQQLMRLPLSLPSIAKKYAPTILVINDYWLLCPTTHFLRWDGKMCRNFSSKECTRCLAIKSSKDFSKEYKIRYLLNHFVAKAISNMTEPVVKKRIEKRILSVKQMIKSVDKIIIISETIKNKFLENGFIADEEFKHDKAVLVTPGINVDSLEKTNKNQYNKLRFGFVGAILERKGVHILIEAFKRLGNVNAELRIYGESTPANRYHKYLLKENNSCPDIKFMGSFDDIEEPYSNIDILVVPSVAYEGYGLVVQEAFAVNTPVIASDIGALNELVKHNQNGLLFKVGSVDDLTQKMSMCIGDRVLLQKLAQGISTVKSIKEQAREHEKIYEQEICRASTNLFKARQLNKRHLSELIKGLPISEALWRFIEIGKLINILRGLKIESPLLDLGCGNGLIGKIVFKKIDVGIDINLQSMGFTQRLETYKNPIIADARQLPFSERTFNTIFSNCTLEHVPNVEYVFKESNRVLKDEGKLIFTVPLASLNSFLLCSSKRYIEMRIRQLQHINLFSLKHWETLCNNFNFKIIKFKFYLVPSTVKIWDFLDIGFHLPLVRKFWSIFWRNISKIFTPMAASVIYNIAKKDRDSKIGGGLIIVAVKR